MASRRSNSCFSMWNRAMVSAMAFTRAGTSLAVHFSVPLPLSNRGLRSSEMRKDFSSLP